MTRIWGITPSLLCDNHLRGQWKELFQLIGSIKKGHSLKGYINKKLITTKDINNYALKVRAEMIKRDFNCKEWVVYSGQEIGNIDLSYNLLDLCERCPKCKLNIIN